MKIILDTNVFLGACLGNGPSNQLVKRCLQGEFSPIMGTALFNEYEDILGREHLFGNARLTATEREELLDIFLGHCQWVKIYYAWRPNLKDEGDNHLIELAVASNARYLITYNLKDFKRMELQFPALKIITPEQFLMELSK